MGQDFGTLKFQLLVGDELFLKQKHVFLSKVNIFKIFYAKTLESRVLILTAAIKHRCVVTVVLGNCVVHGVTFA